MWACLTGGSCGVNWASTAAFQGWRVRQSCMGVVKASVCWGSSLQGGPLALVLSLTVAQHCHLWDLRFACGTPA